MIAYARGAATKLLPVAAFRSIGPLRWGSVDPGAGEAAAYEQVRRPSRSTRLAVGTLACRRCDAPVAVGPGPVTLTEQITCPFCLNREPARDFLSLAAPTRPARVVVCLAYPSAAHSSGN